MTTKIQTSSKSNILIKAILSLLICLSFVATINNALANDTTTESKLKVGVIVPLSGAVAEYGIAIRNGLTLAIEDNQNLASNCDFVYEDSEYSSSKAVSSFEKLAATGTKLVYAFGGPMSEVLAPIAENKKIPIMVDGIDPKVCFGRDYVVRNTNSGLEYGEALSKYLIKKGLKTIGIVKAENQYLNSLVQGLIDSSKNNLKIEEIASISPSESDFKPYIFKILKANYDGVGVFVLPGQISTLTRLLKGKLENKTLLGADFLESSVEVKASKDGSIGAVYPNNLVSEDFRASYTSKYNNDNQLKFGGEGYDVGSLIIKTLCTDKKYANGLEIMQAIKSVKTRTGVLGETVYTETAEGDKYFKAPVRVMEVRKDGFKAID